MRHQSYKEYCFEAGKRVDTASLRAAPASPSDYTVIHKSGVVATQDVFIIYGGGILLLKRANAPAQGEWWCAGGRIARGISAEESLKNVAKRECGLTLHDIAFLGVARTLFQSDPLGHGKGTDTLNLVFVARGEGTIALDATHTDFCIVRKHDYTRKFRSSLNPYLQNYLDILLVRKND